VKFLFYLLFGKSEKISDMALNGMNMLSAG